MDLEMNDEAFVAILQSPEVEADLVRRGNAIAAAAGKGSWVVHTGNTPTRARVSVGTGDFAAMHAEATSRALTSALDAGRG